ncbi:MAG: type I methionyl aminopeptidase [Treponemataceae bacterium]
MIRLKNEKQIDGIRKSCKLLALMFEQIIPKIHAGMSTKEIDDLAVKFIKTHGGVPAWYSCDFPGALCISVNNEVIHGIPSKNKKIKEGDIVSLDGGIDLDGYISDSCRTIAIGKVSKEAEDLMDITKKALLAGISACKVGNRISDISNAVSQTVGRKYGIVTDYCGHGVGLAVHEDPSIPNLFLGGPNPRIQEGMVVAIEPMINIGTGDVKVLDDEWTVVTADGKLSAHQEHTVAVFKDHTEILTIL